MDRIEQKHFEGHDFGTEGTLPFYSDWTKKEASHEELSYILRHTAECVDVRFREQWLKKVDDGSLVEEVIGTQSSYDIPSELQKLREIADEDKSAEQKLMQRSISLMTWDGLNPVSVGKQNLLEIYNDLHITTEEIQPHLNPVSVVNDNKAGITDAGLNEDGESQGAGRSKNIDFYGFRIYQDPTRRIKMHIYYPDREVRPDFDDRPHEHDGASGSIILTGKLVNQHVKPHFIEGMEGSEFGVYLVERNPSDTPELSKRCKRHGYANFETVTSHAYSAGEQYFLPASPRQNYIPEELAEESEKLSFHSVAADVKSATIFTQRFAKDQNLYTTFPPD